MNALIICDIDGCLNSGKYAALDLVSLSRIREQIGRLRQRKIGFTLCTGRPQPYAEAICRMLEIDLPVICENGAMLFLPLLDRVSLLVPEAQRTSTHRVMKKIQSLPWYGDELFLEAGKEICLGITGKLITEKSHAELDRFTDELAKLFADQPLEWTHSTSAIDVTPKGINKGSAINALIKELGSRPATLLGIGDSSGDISFLEQMDIVLCPANSAASVKALSSYVSTGSHATGTLQLLQSHIIKEIGE